MLVTQNELDAVVEELAFEKALGFDTETTGLRAYQNDKLFSIIVASQKQQYYFNFNIEYSAPHLTLPKDWLPRLAPIFSNPYTTYFAHNAKFDLAMLAREGISVLGTVHCTEAVARILRNNHMEYNLGACLKRIGLSKDEAVDEYILKNGLYTDIKLKGKKEKIRLKHFEKVPLEIIVPYGEKDADGVLRLGLWQQAECKEIVKSVLAGIEPLDQVVENEIRVTKSMFHMEQRGIQIDRDFCERALTHELSCVDEARHEFRTQSGIELVDSPKSLLRAFIAVGEVAPGTTEKGNASFKQSLLEKADTPLAKTVLKYREHYKRATTYFQNFIYFSDSQGVLHPNIRQGGTVTGRVSYSEPNLQNLPRIEDNVDEGPFPIRKAFVPRDGFLFAMIDFDQMEYKLMLDYSGQEDLIEMVKSGHDVHEATGELINMPRSRAKTINFGLLYGMGVAKLGVDLGVKLQEAKQIRAQYFMKLPNVAALIRRVMNKAERSHLITNWFGRRYHFDRGMYSHKAPNYLIQGGASDVVKIAMNKIDDHLASYKSKMLVQIHDELLFEIAYDETFLLPQLQHIMESIYPHKKLPLTCSVSHSFTSWGDKKSGFPNKGELDAARNKIKDKAV